jgi:hypothetical protein
MQHTAQKCWNRSTRLQGVTTQKTSLRYEYIAQMAVPIKAWVFFKLLTKYMFNTK